MSFQVTMYTKSARFYDALYSFKNYEKESAQLHEIIQERSPGAKTLLDVACGTGKHLEFLQRDYDCAGLEHEREFVEIARQRLPDARIFQGDYRDFNLGMTFDVVTCLFSAIGYAGSVENLNQAVASMAKHLNPGGILVVEPWFFPGQFHVGYIGVTTYDSPDLKISRMNTSRIENGASIMDMHHLVGTPEEVHHFVETHALSLYTREQYEESFARAALTVDFVEPGLIGRGLFIGQLRAS